MVALDPETVKQAAEFVCNLMLERVHVPAKVAVQFPTIVTFGVI